MKKIPLSLVAAAGVVSAGVLAQPPAAPVDTVVDEYFGTKVEDPYRSLEDLENRDVQQWMRAQADWARQQLDAIPGRDQLLERILEWRIESGRGAWSGAAARAAARG